MPTDQRDILYHMASCSAVKLGKAGKGATVRGLAGHQSDGGKQLFSFASLIFLGFYFSVIFIFFAIFCYYYYCYCYYCYFYFNY